MRLTLIILGWLLATSPALADCKVQNTFNPIFGITTAHVRLGRLSHGVHGVLLKNNAPSAIFPGHKFSLKIQRGNDTTTITKGDSAVFLFSSGAKFEVSVFNTNQEFSTWYVNYAITKAMFSALANDSLAHIQVSFGDKPMDIPISNRKGAKVAKNTKCLTAATEHAPF